MKTPITVVLTASLSVLALAAFAHHDEERIDHYEGKASETLEQAFANFAETNAAIAEILAQDEVTLMDMAKIHEMTYTLENALERIDDEYDELEDMLEEFHLASESGDIEHASGLGQSYLGNAARFQD